MLKDEKNSILTLFTELDSILYSLQRSGTSSALADDLRDRLDKANDIIKEETGWIRYIKEDESTHPTEYGHYEVYRAGCKKQHYETWNTCTWAYNNDITHYRMKKPPIK